MSTLIKKSFVSHSVEQVREACSESLGYPFDVHKRHIPHTALNAAVIRPMQPAALRSLFLIDRLLLANATDGADKPFSEAGQELRH